MKKVQTSIVLRICERTGKSATFGVPGVVPSEIGSELRGSGGVMSSNVFFLKQSTHARSVRNRLLECCERALPSLLLSHSTNNGASRRQHLAR